MVDDIGSGKIVFMNISHFLPLSVLIVRNQTLHDNSINETRQREVEYRKEVVTRSLVVDSKDAKRECSNQKVNQTRHAPSYEAGVEIDWQVK